VFSDFFSENPVFYEIMWEKRCEAGQVTHACCITKAIEPHSEYVIIIAFPREQWSHEVASMLSDTHLACLIYTILFFSKIVSFMR
jgi:hypothetical protein